MQARGKRRVIASDFQSKEKIEDKAKVRVIDPAVPVPKAHHERESQEDICSHETTTKCWT